jgi:putative two-component system response regulator
MPSAARMFRLIDKIVPDLILLDVDMPETDGFEAITQLKAHEKFRDIPVIFLSAMQDENTEIRGFELGALDFIVKPFSAPVLRKRIETHIELDRIVRKSQQEVRDIHNATINVIADLVENRDKITGGHIGRTQKYLTILLEELMRTGVFAEQMADWNLELLIPSAQLHDVGKINISDLILNKPGRLTDEEFAIMKEHCAAGELIIDRIIFKSKNDAFLNHAKLFAGYHHEKWDGTGYPRGLSGEEIPLEGRIMALADVYDALVSERPYKKAFEHEQALEIITEGRETQFDPQIVDAFLNVADDFLVVSVENKLEHAAVC